MTIDRPRLTNRPGVYLIVCSGNAASYVGSSVSMSRRVSQHWSGLIAGKHSNSRLQRAWNKYGRVSFTAHEIEVVPDTSQLIVREQFWIDHHRSIDGNKSLNLSPSAQNTLGYKFSTEAKERIRAANRGRKHSEAFKEACRIRMTGTKHTAEARLKISISNKGKTNPPISLETRAKLSATSRGRKLSDAAKEKIRKARLGIPRSPETRAKLSATKTGKRVPYDIRLKRLLARRANHPQMDFGNYMPMENA